MTEEPVKQPAELAELSHAQLYQMREAEKDPAKQAELGPLEHRAFAREWTSENPYVAIPSLSLGAIPLWTIAKAIGAQHGRSPASLSEMGQSYQGVWEGLMRYLHTLPLLDPVFKQILGQK